LPFPTSFFVIGTLHQVQARSGVSQIVQMAVLVPSRVTGTVGFPHLGHGELSATKVFSHSVKKLVK
jgi:hypothetical protein